MARKTGLTWVIDTRELERVIVDMPNKVDEWLRTVCEEILFDIVMSFGTGPPGRKYRRRKKGRGQFHTASSPLYPPNVDIGALQASMYWYKVRDGVYRVSDQVEYGLWLELGTERMIKRPFITPVFEAWRDHKLAESADRMDIFA